MEQIKIEQIYKPFDEPLNMINKYFADSLGKTLIVNVAIMLVSGLFCASVVYAIYKHGFNTKIDIYVYVLALALLLIIDIIAARKSITDIRHKKKRLTLVTLIPIVMSLFTVYILLQQYYRLHVLHKQTAQFSILLTGFKVLLSFGITIHSGYIVVNTLKKMKSQSI